MKVDAHMKEMFPNFHTALVIYICLQSCEAETELFNAEKTKNVSQKLTEITKIE